MEYHCDMARYSLSHILTSMKGFAGIPQLMNAQKTAENDLVSAINKSMLDMTNAQIEVIKSALDSISKVTNESFDYIMKSIDMYFENMKRVSAAH